MLKISQLDQLTDEVEQTAQAVCNCSRSCLHSLFELQVEQRPDALAVVCGSHELTYEELNRQANRVAAALQRMASPGQIIALDAEHSTDTVAAMLGILKAGMAYLPIDASLPLERVGFILRDANVTTAVARVGTSLANSASFCLSLDEAQVIEESGAAADFIELQSTRRANQLAYIIYTSGSTGNPKGVMLDHRGPVNTILDINRRFNVTAADRVLGLSAFTFDLSVYDVFGTLAAGGTLVLPTTDQARSPAAWRQLIDQHSVTVWNTVPALMEMFVGHLEARQQDAASLRKCFLSGDWIPVSLPDRIRCVAPDSHIIGMGGATEASIWSNYFEIERVDAQWSSIPYGKALAGQTIDVLTTDFQPLPIGEVGEIHIGGVGVALGYLNRAELTADRFVDTVRGRIYRTGDLGRLMADGNIEFLGRMDQQVKINGYRVELGEIESHLIRHPLIQSCVVTASRKHGRSLLVAYYIGTDESSPTLDDLRTFLQRALPNYMLPTQLVRLSQWPLSSNGKVDRSRLPCPTADSSATEHSQPQTDTERSLADYFCEQLHCEQVDLNAGFLSLGGDSLLAVSTVLWIEDTFGLRLPSTRLLENKTSIVQLARLIETKDDQKTGPCLPPIQTIAQTDRCAVSFAQQQMWIVDRLAPESPTYNVAFGYWLDGELHLNVLEQALRAVTQQHEVLRTLVESDGNGAVVQRVCSDLKPTLERLTQSADTKLTLRERAWSTASQYAKRRFNLSSELPIRAGIVAIDPQAHLLVINVHHIAVDSHAIAILQRDLSAAYTAILNGQVPAFAPSPIRYTDFAHWQREQVLQSDKFQLDKEYWQTKLAGQWPTLTLPTLGGVTANQSLTTDATPGETYEFRVPVELNLRWRALAKQHDASMFVTMLTVFKTLLWRYTQQSDLVVGSPVSIRNHREIADVVGCFLNVLPLRTEVTGDMTFADLLARVRDVVHGGLSHADYPLELMDRELLTDRDPTQAVFQTMFVYEAANQHPLQLPGLKVSADAISTQTAKFDVLLTLIEDEQELAGFIEYRSDLFAPWQIETMAQHFTMLLEQLFVSTDKCLADIALEFVEADTVNSATAGIDSQFESEYLHSGSLHSGSLPTQHIAATDSGLLAMFQRQVELNPTATAVRFQNTSLSYQQLDQRANQLAHLLIERGVTANQLVGICLDRSPELLIAILAVLKSGGAYVFLDPAHPTEKTRSILQSANPLVVLTRDGFESKLPTCRASVVNLDDDVEATPSTAPPVQVAAKSLAYVMYTSGSTGEPKGVAMSHQALGNLIQWQIAHSGAGPGWKTLQFATAGFDVSFQEIFATWCTGGELVCVPEQLHRDLRGLWQFVCDEQIHRLFVPFVVLQAFAQCCVEERVEDALREVITAGEQLQSTTALRRMFAVRPECRLWNHYGPTETHVVTAYLLDSTPESWATLPSIGRAIWNTKLYVLDAQRQALPAGIPGDLYVGGVALADGYYGREELTDERFTHHAQYGRLYRTGDIAMLRPDGNLEFMGRADQQVKIRGHRVELGEIETVLATHADVQLCVVVASGTGAIDRRLVAHIVPRSGHWCEKSLSKHLASRLPAYMLPSNYIAHSALPSTASGKVDRLSLSRQPVVRLAESTEGQQPKDAIESKLCLIWCDVLGLKSVSTSDSFFELGGTSLDAVILFERLDREFQRKLSLSTLVSRPTIADLAVLIREQVGSDHWQSLFPLKTSGTRAPLFCLPGIDGHLLNFRHLAAAVADDQPVYGLQPHGLDGVAQPYETIEQIAAQHIRVMRSVQPTGPYQLAGFSLGGIVAFEMARQLHADGQRVELLALIDSYAGMIPQPNSLQRAMFHVRRTLFGTNRWEYFKERIRLASLALRVRRQRLTEEDHLSAVLGLDANYTRVAMANMRALRAYELKPLDCAAHLFRSKIRPNWPRSADQDEMYGWSRLLQRGVSVEDVPGAHRDALSQLAVPVIIRSLKQRLG